MIRTLFFLWLLTSVCWSSTTAAEDHWPRFQGPSADGVAPDHHGLPITWTTTKNVKWVADVPGWGWSCPVVWGDRVFLWTVSRYIHRNPVRERRSLVTHPQDWTWSSYPGYARRGQRLDWVL